MVSLFASRKSILALFVALSLCSVSAFAQYKICIDPGHGGTDPGAGGGGYNEKDLVLDTSLKFKAWMDLDTQDTAGGGSWTVIMTRSTDVFVTLTGRCTYANNNSATRFMSIHNNSFNASANGIETFCWGSGSANSFDLRNKVYEEAVAMWPLVQRGTKTANYTVLTGTNMPAELHECAFIDSSIDRVYLTNATHRNNHAKSELFAIQRQMGYAKYTPTSTVIVTVDNASSGFAASTNWYTSTSTAGYYGTNYHVRSTAAASDAATFTGTLPSAGSYKVEAWWTAGTNRPAAAPFIVYYNGGSATVNVNQQANGSKWNTLGTWSFASGSNQVKLSCWTTVGYYVIADAVKFTKQ